MRKAILISAMLLVLSACGTTKGTSQMSDSGNHQNNEASAQMVTKQKKSADSNKTNRENMEQAKKKNNGHVLNVTAHDFAFNKDKYVVQSGKVTIHFKSVQGTHGFALYKSPSSTEKIVNIIGKGTKTVKLSPGTYYIHCSVVCGGGHGNMDATLVVK